MDKLIPGQEPLSEFSTQKRVSNDVDGNPEYVGVAISGASEDDEVWSIAKYDWSNGISKKVGRGSWTGRASVSYS